MCNLYSITTNEAGIIAPFRLKGALATRCNAHHAHSFGQALETDYQRGVLEVTTGSNMTAA
jgi:hypothetical protein